MSGKNRTKTWAEIRALYETGNYSQRELAEQSGFKENTIAHRVLDEGWVKGKNAEKIQKETEKKILKFEISKVTKLKNNVGEFFHGAFAVASTQMGWLVKKAVKKKEKLTWEELKRLKILTEIGTNCKDLLWNIHKLDGEENDKAVDETAEILRGIMEAHLETA